MNNMTFKRETIFDQLELIKTICEYYSRENFLTSWNEEKQDRNEDYTLQEFLEIYPKPYDLCNIGLAYTTIDLDQIPDEMIKDDMEKYENDIQVYADIINFKLKVEINWNPIAENKFDSAKAMIEWLTDVEFGDLIDLYYYDPIKNK